MKRVLILFVILAGLVSCKAMIKDLKNTNRIRKTALSACDCKFVGVEKGYDAGNSLLTISLRKSWSADRLVTADNILTALRDSFPKICNYGQIFIIFEGDEFNERFTYYGCDFEAERDTILLETELDEEDWETFMDSLDVSDTH